MGRGLGQTQRLILDALMRRAGGDWVGSMARVPELCAKYGSDFRLSDGFHDLRMVAYELARDTGGFSHCTFIAPWWQASFSRAVRGLHERGLIEVPSIVPLAEDRIGRGVQCSDGLYLVGRQRQRRFVRVLAEIHNA